MCLYTKQTEPEIAEEDIICYKFYVRYDETLFSPYQESRAPEIGIITNTELEKSYRPRDNGSYIHNLLGFKRVDKGFHSFKTLEEAEREVNDCWNNLDLVIFKCIIPRGSSYYKGIFGDRYESYCSNSIKLIEICV